jgi:Endoplasmic reticulum vesicle transporter
MRNARLTAHVVSLTTWHAQLCAKVREAYRRRGWGFNNPQGIAQCEKEGFLTKLKVTSHSSMHAVQNCGVAEDVLSHNDCMLLAGPAGRGLPYVGHAVGE